MRLVALTFNVQTLEGDLRGGDGSAAVVIDIIGRPLTPLSCTGVARRSAPLSAVPLRRMNEGGLALPHFSTSRLSDRRRLPASPRGQVPARCCGLISGVRRGPIGIGPFGTDGSAPGPDPTLPLAWYHGLAMHSASVPEAAAAWHSW
jgi:hypothetical protein